MIFSIVVPTFLAPYWRELKADCNCSVYGHFVAEEDYFDVYLSPSSTVKNW